MTHSGTYWVHILQFSFFFCLSCLEFSFNKTLFWRIFSTICFITVVAHVSSICFFDSGQASSKSLVPFWRAAGRWKRFVKTDMECFESRTDSPGIDYGTQLSAMSVYDFALLGIYIEFGLNIFRPQFCFKIWSFDVMLTTSLQLVSELWFWSNSFRSPFLQALFGVISYEHL